MATAMKELKGFTVATKAKTKRLVLNVEGMEKEGKTSFGLSAPGPIALFNLDVGLEGVIDRWLDEKQIFVAEFNYREATDPNQWASMWDKMRAAYMEALKCPHVRTVMIDTGTELWELVRLARFGKLSQVQPHHYGPVNAEFRDMIRKGYASDKNIVFLHKLKPMYIDDKRTRNYEMSGFSGIPYDVQANIRVWREVDKDGKPEEPSFRLLIRDCRQNADVAGEELRQPMNTFAFVAATIFPDTDPSDWE